MDADGKKKLVIVAEKTIPAAVQQASGWALFNACGTVVYFALVVAVTYALGVSSTTTSAAASKSSFVLRCVEWTDAEAAGASALWLGMLCCAVLQAAAAALALQLPCRRRWVRRDLAHLTLALTFVGHWMYAVHVRLLLAADPGYLFRISYTIDIVISVVVDLLCFLDLLQGGEDED